MSEWLYIADVYALTNTYRKPISYQNFYFYLVFAFILNIKGEFLLEYFSAVVDVCILGNFIYACMESFINICVCEPTRNRSISAF